MPVKIIVDTSNATKEEIEAFKSMANSTLTEEMFSNSRKHNIEFVNLVDPATAANYYLSQTFPGSEAMFMDFKNSAPSNTYTPEGEE